MPSPDAAPKPGCECPYFLDGVLPWCPVHGDESKRPADDRTPARASELPAEGEHE